MACITVIFGGQKQGIYELAKENMNVGRDPKCDIYVDNLGISREHCLFIRKGEEFWIKDLGSSNGTYMNGQKIDERLLADGDEIFIGKYILRYQAASSKEEDSDLEKVFEKEAAVRPHQPAPNIERIGTYVIEDKKIQEQVAKQVSKMQKQAATREGANSEKSQEVENLKKMVIALAILVAILLIAVVAFLLKG